MSLTLVTPADPIVSLAEIKRHVRADFNDDDSYLESLVAVATEQLNGKDGITGQSFGAQTWDYVLDAFPEGVGPIDGGIKLPLPPLVSVTYVRYIDPDTGLEVTLVNGTDYEVDTYSQPGWILPSTAGWPTPMETINAVRIRYVAGTVPVRIKHAVMLHAGHLYKYREMDAPNDYTRSDTYKSLIKPFERVYY
jgi:uncharacterized phiE125 gp8 family phage protein